MFALMCTVRTSHTELQSLGSVAVLAAPRWFVSAHIQRALHNFAISNFIFAPDYFSYDRKANTKAKLLLVAWCVYGVCVFATVTH